MEVLAVGTRNPAKVAAVANVVKKLFGTRFRVVSAEVKSGIPRQPVGLMQNVKGAVNRAEQAMSVISGAKLGVGIEAGLVKVPRTLTGYFDIQFAAIVDSQGRVTIGCGPGFEYPPRVVEEVLSKGREVGEVMESLTGIEDIGEKMGAIGFLSHGELDRCGLTEQAIFMAFIPRMNEELYLKK